MRDYDNDDRTIGRVLPDKAARCGDRPFLRFAGRVISYLRFIGELPKTPSEKVEKYKLKLAAAESRAQLWDHERRR